MLITLNETIKKIIDYNCEFGPYESNIKNTGAKGTALHSFLFPTEKINDKGRDCIDGEVKCYELNSNSKQVSIGRHSAKYNEDEVFSYSVDKMQNLLILNYEIIEKTRWNLSKTKKISCNYFKIVSAYLYTGLNELALKKFAKARLKSDGKNYEIKISSFWTYQNSLYNKIEKVDLTN